MDYTVQIMGHAITLSREPYCPCCDVRTTPDLIQTVMDNDNGIIRYVIISKCSSCRGLSYTKYIIGSEKELDAYEKEPNMVAAPKVSGRL